MLPVDKMEVFRLALLSVVLTAYSCTTLEKFDDDVISFLETHHYRSTALGVMVDGKMVYTKGFTLDGGSPLAGDATKIWPIGKLSETLTALAVLKLYESGDIRLNETVFGNGSILSDLTPMKRNGKVDDRVYDITVQDLLSHSSGWDATAAPLFDPALNAYYLKKRVHVPDIQDEIGTLHTLSTRHIIRYMLNQPLHYQPGTKSISSVFHYGILAEIIESVTGQDYRKYVKKYILELCGMWSTRLGPEHHPSDPADIDTTAASRGWFSNVFDLLRMMKCIDGTGRYRILSDKTIRLMVARDEELSGNDNWHGLGFLTNGHHSIWQVMTGSTHNAVLWHNTIIAPDTETPRPSQSAFVFLFDSANASNTVNKHFLNRMVRSVDKWPSVNLFPLDLTDVSELPENHIFKIDVPERHMKAYANAVKSEYYDITWVSGAHDSKSTHFSVVSKYRLSGENYIFECGLTQRTLYDHRKLLDSYSYEMHFMQGYISQSHGSKYRYLTVSSKVGHKSDIVVGTHVDNKQYKNVFVSNRIKGYVPMIQSVTYEHGRVDNDYIFVKKSNDNYKAYINMHLDNMEDVIETNANDHRAMSYLDVTDIVGVPTFSAIFSESTYAASLFRKDVSRNDLLVLIENHKSKGMIPRIIVGYSKNNGPLRYILYMSANKK